MFSWFLKLLGIDEDRPNTSGSSYLDSSANKTTKTTKSTTNETQAEEKPKPAAEAKPKSAPEPKPQEETPKEKPKPPEKAKEAAAKSAAKSLADEFPDLKANYVKVLEDAGFTTKAAIDKVSDKELLALKGIGQASLKIMRG